MCEDGYTTFDIVWWSHHGLTYITLLEIRKFLQGSRIILTCANKRPLAVDDHTYCACWLDLTMALLPRLQAPIGARQDNIPGCVRSCANQRACKRDCASCRRQDLLGQSVG